MQESEGKGIMEAKGDNNRIKRRRQESERNLGLEGKFMKNGVVSPEDLEALRARQKELASKAIISNGFKEPIKRVAAVDLAFLPKSENAVVAVLVFSIKEKDFETIETVHVQGELRFPYIPGFLAFREGPLILDGLRRLSEDFDVLLCNAHGIAHPLGCGCSTYVGVEIGKPTIGVAKGILCGSYIEPTKVGDWTPIIYNDRIVGAAILTKPGCRPIFVSPGHLVSVESSARIVLNLVRDHRFPEPLWKAHEMATKAVKQALKDR
jgi:deoxyribonuclease V